MGKVECFGISGLEIWFWSEDHHPPHFHAKKADSWEVKVKFLEVGENEMFKIKWERKPFSAKDRKALANEVKDHRLELLKE